MMQPLLLKTTVRTGLTFILITALYAVVNAKAVDPPTAIARVLAITVDGKIAPEAKPDEVVVTRANSATVGGTVKTGMELFANDELQTFENASVSILFLNTAPDKNNEILIGPKSRITISSVTCNFACKLFARLKDLFDGKNRSVQLDNEGTEYEFTTFDDGSSALTVFEGAVNVTRIHGSGKHASAAASAEEPRLVPAGYYADSVKVRPLHHVNIDADGHVGSPKHMSFDDTKIALAWSTAAIIALHPTDPTKGGEGISKYSPFGSNDDRNRAFSEARLQSLWSQDPKSIVTLAQVYSDWAEGVKAIDLYAKAEQLYRKNNSAWEPPANLLLAKAEANRLIGNYDAATSLATTAITKDASLSEVGNIVLGNIKYSQAIAVRNVGNSSAARSILAEAANAYSASYDLHQRNEQLAVTNLGVTFQALANITGENYDKKSILLSRSRYLTAANFLEDTQGKNPGSPLAKTARADIFTVRGINARSRVNPESAAKYYDSAESYYREVIEENPEFAPAYKGLGNLYELRGQRDEALKYYEQWASLNPTVKTGVDQEAPDLTGKSTLAALQIVTSAGFIPSVTGEGDWIAAQDIPPGTKLPAGSKVSLRLSTAKPISAGRVY